MDSPEEYGKYEAINLSKLKFPGPIFASGTYPTGLVINEVVHVRSSCVFGFLVVDFERKEARIFEVELHSPFLSKSFTERE